MNILDAIAAINAFKNAFINKVAPEEEVSERMKICVNCPKLHKGHGLSSSISKTLGRLANQHRVSDKIANKHCSVCGCSMMLLLPVLLEDAHKDTPEQRAMRPKNCWLLKQTPQ